MRAIDATQLIVNRINNTRQSIARDDLLKVLYLLDNALFKESGKHLIDEKFSFNSNGPFIEDVYKHFTLWKKDDYNYRTAQIKHNLGEKELDNINGKISELSKCSSWELNSMIFDQLNNGKHQRLDSNIIADHNRVNDEILNRCRIMLELVKTRVEFIDYGKVGLHTSVPDDLAWLTKLDTGNIYFSIKEQDDGNFKMKWQSYDTFEYGGDEEAVISPEFINNFDEYCNKIKIEIEANNEVEIAKYKEFQEKEKEANREKEMNKLKDEIAKKTKELDDLKQKVESNSGLSL